MDTAQLDYQMSLSQYSEAKIKNILKSNLSLNIIDSEGLTPLLWSIINDNHLIFHRLIANPLVNINLSSIKMSNMTPLIVTINLGKKEMAAQLIKRGAKIDLADALRRTPLMHAAEEGDTQTLALLLNKSKASIDMASKEGKTSLVYAVLSGVLENVILLLNAGAKPNSSYRSYIPLICASTVGNLPITDCLLNAGANTSFINNQEFTAFDLAVQKEHLETAFRLLGEMSSKEITLLQGSEKYALVIGKYHQALFENWLTLFNIFGAYVLKEETANKDFPEIPRELIKFMLPSNFPQWYQHRLLQDIEYVFRILDKIKAKRNENTKIDSMIDSLSLSIKACFISPQPLIFSRPRCQTSDNYAGTCRKKMKNISESESLGENKKKINKIS